MRISDWSSDVCSSDLGTRADGRKSMTKWIGTGGRVALAVCATVGLAPDCLAQFAATEQPPEQRDAQQRPAEPPPGKQRSSIAVPVVPAQPVTIIGNPGNSRRGQFEIGRAHV